MPGRSTSSATAGRYWSWGEALAGTTRFGDFRKHLGLARNILSARLRLLVEHGILEARACADRCDWNEYHLTAKGRQLQPVLAALRQ